MEFKSSQSGGSEMFEGNRRSFRTMPAGLVNHEDRVATGSDVGSDLIDEQAMAIATSGIQRRTVSGFLGQTA
jgi:hypothetical protein